jgi:hypothetical protein
MVQSVVWIECLGCGEEVQATEEQIAKAKRTLSLSN